MTPDRNTEEGEILHILETAADVRHHDVVFPEVNKSNHRWRQRGMTVHCDSCPSGHGFHINHDEHLTGIDAQGMPVIEKIVHTDARNIKGPDIEGVAESN